MGVHSRLHLMATSSLPNTNNQVNRCDSFEMTANPCLALAQLLKNRHFTHNPVLSVIA